MSHTYAQRDLRPEHDARSPQNLYRLILPEQWKQAVRNGFFEGAATDRADGFIHLSTARQVIQTARRWFSGTPELVLLRLDRDRLAGTVRLEESSHGGLYPHLYGLLPIEAVMEIWDLPLNGDLHFVFPTEIILASS